MITRTAALLLSLLVSVPGAHPQTGGQAGHLTPQSTIGDLLRHPAFTGFSRLLLPWDDRAYDERMPLTRIGSLLPYHTHVDPQTVASALNRMIDRRMPGRAQQVSPYAYHQATLCGGRDPEGSRWP